MRQSREAASREAVSISTLIAARSDNLGPVAVLNADLTLIPASRPQTYLPVALCTCVSRPNKWMLDDEAGWTTGEDGAIELERNRDGNRGRMRETK